MSSTIDYISVIYCVDLHKHRTETILTTISEGPHGKNGSTAYSPKLMATTPNNAGFNISTDVQANKKAGIGPSDL